MENGLLLRRCALLAARIECWSAMRYKKHTHVEYPEKP